MIFRLYHFVHLLVASIRTLYILSQNKQIKVMAAQLVIGEFELWQVYLLLCLLNRKRHLLPAPRYLLSQLVQSQLWPL